MSTKAKTTVYRVCTTVGVGEGIWYDSNGQQKNLGLPAFSFYHLPSFAMQYSEKLVGWISVTLTLEDLSKWFSVADIRKLEPLGYYVTEFEAELVKEYEYTAGQFHIVADKKTMHRKRIIPLAEYAELIGQAFCQRSN